MKVIFLLTFHWINGRRLPASKTLCGKQREQQTPLRAEVGVKLCSQEPGPHQSCIKILMEKKKVQDLHHILRLLAILEDIGIGHHYSNWWCNPIIYPLLGRKKKSSYEKKTKLLGVRLIILFFGIALKNIFFQFLISYGIKPPVISQCEGFSSEARERLSDVFSSGLPLKIELVMWKRHSFWRLPQDPVRTWKTTDSLFAWYC